MFSDVDDEVFVLNYDEWDGLSLLVFVSVDKMVKRRWFDVLFFFEDLLLKKRGRFKKFFELLIFDLGKGG